MLDHTNGFISTISQRFSYLGSTARSRRCVTQRNFPKYSPSEYARLHSPSSPAGAMYTFTNSTNIAIYKPPVAIAEEMSRLDPHYIPSPAPG